MTDLLSTSKVAAPLSGLPRGMRNSNMRRSSRRTMTGLSAISCDLTRKPFFSVGSIVTRNSGASLHSDVIRQITTDTCTAGSASVCTITAGRGRQARFSTTSALQAADDEFGALHAWVNQHLSDALPLSVLAGRAGMSERSFSRRHLEATGISPARAIERLRVEAACRLPEESDLPAKRISQHRGLGSEETLRRCFLRLLAVTPQDYRARFGTPFPRQRPVDNFASAAPPCATMSVPIESR